MGNYKPVGVDKDGKFPPRIQTALNGTVNEAVTPLVQAQVPPLVTAALAASPTPANAAAAAATTAVANEVASKNLVTGADSRLPQTYAMESDLDVGWADTNDKVVFGLDIERGVVVAPVLESKSIDATTVNGVEKMTGVTDFGSGLIYGFVDQNERIWEPLAVDENGQHPQWVLDRMAARMVFPSVAATKYKPVTSAFVPAVERNVVSGPNVVGWGHSMLAGAGGAGVSVLSTLSAETGLTCKNGSVGGESSSSIIARQGGTPLLLLPEGGQIPASGSVVIPTFPIESGGAAWPLLQGAGTDNGKMMGVLAGVPGEIVLTRAPDAQQYVRDSRDVYTFVRTTPGTAVTVNRPAPFYYDFSQARRDDIAVFWIGRNNISAYDRVYNDLRRAIQYMTPLDKRFIVLADTNGANEGTGTATFNNLQAYNTKVQNEYGRRFIDIRRYLIDYALSDEGITPTTQDNADIAADIVPTSLRSDNLHLNAAGYRVVGKLVAARMRELGWVI